MGVLIESGVIERTTRALAGSRAATPAGAVPVIALGTSLVTVAYGGVNSAAMATFGPIVDRIGAAVGLHLYRREQYATERLNQQIPRIAPCRCAGALPFGRT